MLDLWLRILDIMDRLMNSGQGDHLEEAVPESLKNILLVMADGGFIKPPVDGQPRTELWDETCKRVDRFLPNLIVEIFPEVGKVPEKEKEGAKEKEVAKEETGAEDDVGKKSVEQPPVNEPQPQDVD